jgi:uncharacterized membrane protein YvbJ
MNHDSLDDETTQLTNVNIDLDKKNDLKCIYICISYIFVIVCFIIIVYLCGRNLPKSQQLF